MTYPPILDLNTGLFRSVKVLVLGDDAGASNAGPYMTAYLNSVGFNAVYGGFYPTWTPPGDLNTYDTLLWLQGVNYFTALQAGVDQQIVSFVRRGGGLVRTEWAAWFAGAQIVLSLPITNPLSYRLLPVSVPKQAALGLGSDSVAFFNRGLGVRVIKGQEDHPLAKGLPGFYASGSASVFMDLKAEAHAVLQTEPLTPNPVFDLVTVDNTPQPALSYTMIHGGTVVHVNDSLFYSNGSPVRAAKTLEPEVLRVYGNAVHFAARKSFIDRKGSLMESMIINSPAVESTPNVVPPDPARLFKVPVPKDRGLALDRTRMLFWIEDGTSATVSLWTLVGSNNWVLLESGISISAVLTAVRSTTNLPADAFLFAQVTAVTGATKIKGAFV